MGQVELYQCSDTFNSFVGDFFCTSVLYYYTRAMQVCELTF